MKYKGFWMVVALFVIAAGGMSFYSYQERQPLVYRESLMIPAVTVDGRTLTMGDLAYYIAAEELEVEKQATIYDSEHMDIYWALRVRPGKLMKTEAKEMVLDAAVHDEIFYQMAKEAGFTLGEEEQELLEMRQYDFWSDLTEEQQERLGVEKQELMERMEQIAIAQQYQFIYGMEHSIVAEDYAMDGEKYQELLKEHSVKVNKSEWNRIPFGKIIFGSNES